MKEKFAKLIDLKSIVTLVLVSAAVYGFVKGIITAELFATWVTAIVVFYFTKDKKTDVNA
jgi:hypothetical protein